MNPSSVDPNEASNSPTQPAPSEASIIEAENEFKASTPKTLPLKRSNSPLFVPVVLSAETTEAETLLPAESIETSEISVENPPVPELEEQAQPELTSLKVEFSPPSDMSYQSSVTLELGCTEPKASIHYALDAQDVGEDGLLYKPAEKIFLTQTASIAARAFLEGQAGPLALGRFEVAKPGWKKIEPTDQSDATPHEIMDEAALEGSWRLAAASVRGKLHAHRGLWREDAFRHGLAHASDGTYSVIVVSDGAGSVPLSRVGSNLLCQVAIDFLVTSLTTNAPLASESKTLVERDLPVLRTLLVESAQLALQKLREEATNRSRPLSDFSSTLLILIRREWNNQQLCAALQAGDGSIALWNGDQTLTLLGEADHGEHSSETKFLTTNGMEAELPARVKFSIRPDLRAVAVMTDGVADDFFPEPVRFPELFGAILPVVSENETMSSSTALLNWIAYEKKGSSDDRTLVLCWKAGAGEGDKNGNP